MRKKLLTVITLGYVFMSYAGAQDFKTTVNTLYTTYIRPGLIALVILLFFVTGMIKMMDFFKGGDAAKEAFILCIKMAAYPFFVLALTEALNLLLF